MIARVELGDVEGDGIDGALWLVRHYARRGVSELRGEMDVALMAARLPRAQLLAWAQECRALADLLEAEVLPRLPAEPAA